jgi:hypothetical protein
MARTKYAADTSAAIKGFRTIRARMLSRTVFPHRFAGLKTARRGLYPIRSETQVWPVHSVVTKASWGLEKTTY